MRCRRAAAAAAALAAVAAAKEVQVSVVPDGSRQPFGTVPPDFLSYTIDLSQISDCRHPEPPAVLSSEVASLAAELSPATLRIGGTQGDYNFYRLGSETCASLPAAPASGNRTKCVLPSRLDDIGRFAAAAKVSTITFGLSLGYPLGKNAQHKNGSMVPWDESNALAFLDYVTSRGWPLRYVELGNEVDEGPLKRDASFQAEASSRLASKLREKYSSVKLVGPAPHSFILRAAAEDFKYIEDFVQQTCESKAIAAYTYHSYVNRADLLTSAGLGEQATESGRFKEAVAKHCPGAPVIAGEIAEHNQGGLAGTTNTFLDSFWYLDALETTALQGHEAFYRQTLRAGGYGLLDGNSGPLPDYWLAVLHKRLAGTRVLAVKSSTSTVRVYARCARDSAGDVVLMHINLHNLTAVLELGEDLRPSAADGYVLTADGGDVRGAAVALNGQRLALAGGRVPALPPRPAAAAASLAAPGPSLGFHVLKGTALGRSACGAAAVVV